MLTMAEYIEREALINELLSNAFTDDLYGMGLTRGIEISVAAAKRINAADVSTVRNGRWNDDGGIIICSECGRGFNLVPMYTHYCPWCGAKMDGSDTND